MKNEKLSATENVQCLNMHVFVRALLTQEIMRSKDAQCNSGELPT